MVPALRISRPFGYAVDPASSEIREDDEPITTPELMTTVSFDEAFHPAAMAFVLITASLTLAA
jgi:hypothetical protein